MKGRVVISHLLRLSRLVEHISWFSFGMWVRVLQGEPPAMTVPHLRCPSEHRTFLFGRFLVTRIVVIEARMSSLSALAA